MANAPIDIGIGDGGVSVGTGFQVGGTDVSIGGTIPIGGGGSRYGGAPVGGGRVAVRYSSNPRSHGFKLVKRHQPQGGLWRNDSQRTLYITDQVSQFKVKPGGMFQQMSTGQILPEAGTEAIVGPPSFEDAMSSGQGTRNVDQAKNAAGNAASAREREREQEAGGMPADRVQTTRSSGPDTSTILLALLAFMALGGGASRRRRK